MAATHTPGPWAVDTVPTSCGICHKVGPFPGKRPGDKPRHACLYADYPSKGNPPDDELEANARLIAAAPDMLGALQAICDQSDRIRAANGVPRSPETQALYERARAAIAKATGAAS